MEFKKFSSLENTYNGKIIDKVVHEGHASSQWVVTEKIDGANFSFWCDGSEVKVASRNQFVDGTFFNCQKVINAHSEKFLNYVKDNFPGEVVVVYGELFGANIQNRVNYGTEVKFVAFDMRVNGEPINKTDVALNAPAAGFECNKILFIGTYEEAMAYPHEFRSHYTPDSCDADDLNEAEGIVIEPVIPAKFNNGSRIYFKKKTARFSEKKNRTHKTPSVLPDDVSEILESVLEYCTESRVHSVISKIGEVTNKDFGRVGGLLVQDMIEDYEKDTDTSLKEVVEDHWKQFVGCLNREAIATARPVILGVMV